MINLRFHLREDLLEYNVVDFLVDGEYCGTATIKAKLMTDIGTALAKSDRFNFDITDGRART